MKIDKLKQITEKVNLYTLGVLSPPRYAHSIRVAFLARDLCERFGVDPYAGYLAGIAHDMCKSGKDTWLLSLAVQDPSPITLIEKEKPALLHGRAASVLLQTEFDLHDDSILFAIKSHTFGAPDLDSLGKILFIADKIEPGRVSIDPVFRDKILSSSLDVMASMVLEDNIRYLKAKDKEVSGATLLMFESLEGRKKDK